MHWAVLEGESPTPNGSVCAALQQITRKQSEISRFCFENAKCIILPLLSTKRRFFVPNPGAQETARNIVRCALI